MSPRQTLIAGMALSCLSSCNQQQTSTDGYRFERKEFVHASPAVTFVQHASIEELRKAAPREASAGSRTLMAWSILRGNACEVHIVDPTVSYQPEWIGHEVTHCIFGRWHQ